MESSFRKLTICSKSPLGEWDDRSTCWSFTEVPRVTGRDITFGGVVFFGVGNTPSHPVKAIASELQAARNLRRVSLFAIRESLVSYKVV